MNRQRLALKLAALCLLYPGPGLESALAAVEGAAPDLERAAASPFTAFMEGMKARTPLERETRYVAAFDFFKERALYLTFHELAESTERAAALLELKALIEAAGFGVPEGELPDYIPLLLEFLAEAPEAVPTGDLPVRLAAVLKRIAASLAPVDPLYALVCQAALTALPDPEDRPVARQNVVPPAFEAEDVPYPLRLS